MARGVNKVILLGNLGNDPDIIETNSGVLIATISLATTSVRKDRDGNAQEKTEWHRVKFFGKLAEIVEQYVNKGDQIFVEGRIEYGSYEKDGVKHYTTDIIGDNMQMVGGRRDSGARDERQAGRSDSGRGRQEAPRGRSSEAPRARQAEPARRRPPVDDLPMDDDIPF